MKASESIVLIDKPFGWTSSDCVQCLKRRFQWKKAGHAGTLDPIATGVLIILVNDATKRFADFQGAPKTYRTGLMLGVSTDSHDISGKTMRFHDIGTPPDIREIKEALLRFKGSIKQVPPSFSALKIQGKPAYIYAREGKVVPDLAPREVTIHSLELIQYDFPKLVLEMSVSSGFYVRSLCSDLGEVLKSGAVMTELVRTHVGKVGLKECQSLEELKDMTEPVYHTWQEIL